MVQMYDVAPLAVSCRLSPAHSVRAPDGVIVTGGAERTCTLKELLLTWAGEAHDEDDVT